MNFSVLSLLVFFSISPAEEDSKNPLFESLTRSPGPHGVVLQKPQMPDGLSKQEQLAVIEAIPGRRVSVDDMTRKATSAPVIVESGKLIKSGDVQYRTIDIYFLVYATPADFDVDKANQVQESDEGQQHRLTADELAERDIRVKDTESRDQGWIHIDLKLLDRVHLKSTVQYQMTQTEESTLVAMKLDPRFNNDPKFPNQWQAIRRPSSREKVKPPQLYSLNTMYMKATKMEQSDLVFVEYHVAMENPPDWFNGRDLLKSKIKIGSQNGIRKLRAEILEQQKARQGQ